MSPNSLNRPGQPNLGTGPHSSGRSPNPLVNYELSGTVRWLDAALERIVVDVRETDGHAGVFQGQDVTVDLECARVHGGDVADLLPGTAIRIKCRLPRELDGRLPDLLPALSVTVLPAA